LLASKKNGCGLCGERKPLLRFQNSKRELKDGVAGGGGRCKHGVKYFLVFGDCQETQAEACAT
jgi:hypothetical protein